MILTHVSVAVYCRRESESSKMSAASDEGFSDASFSLASENDGREAAGSDSVNPLQYLARAAAEVSAATSNQLLPKSNLASRRVAPASSADCQATKKKRGVGRRPSRSEAQAVAGSSARTEGLRRCEGSGVPARMTGSSQLSKVPANAKIGHLRSRYSAVPLLPLDCGGSEQLEGDSFVIMSSGFDHDYATKTLAETSFSYVPLISRGCSTDHEYSRSPSLWTPLSGTSTVGPRRSLGDLSALPSMSLSPLLPLRDPLATTLPSPMEPLTIDDANLVNQLPPSKTSLDHAPSATSPQQETPDLNLATSYAFRVLAAKGNFFGSPPLDDSTSAGLAGSKISES